MSRPLIALVLAVDLAALAAVALLPATGLTERVEAALLFIALAALVGAKPVRLPSLRVNMTATHPLVLCTLAAVGPAAAVLVNLAGLVGAAKGRGRRPLAASPSEASRESPSCAPSPLPGVAGRTPAERR